MDQEFNLSDTYDSETVVTKGDYVSYDQRPETYIVPLVFGIIFLVGLIGNGCLICIFCREPSVRSSIPNTFIFNLALGDLLVLFCSVPFTSTIYTFESWPYGEFVCKASEYAKDTSVGVSVFTLTALSLDRYRAIVQSVQSFTSGRSKVTVIASSVFIWLVSLTLALPSALFSHLRILSVPGGHRDEQQPEINNNSSNWDNITDSVTTQFDTVGRNISVCYPYPEYLGPDYPKMIVLSRFLIHYCLPLVAIGTFYTIMAHHLFQSTKEIPGQALLSSSSSTKKTKNPQESSVATDQAVHHNQIQSRRKLAKMVLSFVVLFALCYLPIQIFFLWFHFDPNSLENYNTYWNVLKIVGFCLAYTNSCVNPIALYCVSTSFRHHFNRILCCCCPSLRKRMTPRSATIKSNASVVSMTNSMSNSASQRRHFRHLDAGRAAVSKTSSFSYDVESRIPAAAAARRSTGIRRHEGADSDSGRLTNHSIQHPELE